MSLCGNTPRANDLNYCTTSHGASYSGAILHVGELVAGYDFAGDTLAVLFKDMATGRVTLTTPNEDAFPAIEVIQPGDLSPGAMYEITLVGPSEAAGIQPLPFYPYAYSTGSGNYAASTDTADGVFVKFTKVFDGNGDVHSHTEQWISLR